MCHEPITREYLREQLKEQAVELRGEMKDMEGRLRGEMKQLGDDLRGEMKDMEGRLRGEMKQLGDDLRGEMKGMEGRLLREIGLALNVAVEQIGKLVKVVDEKYQEVPARTYELRQDLDDHRSDWRIHKEPSETPPRRRTARTGK
ncbi:MAG: hypothetical protein HY698_16620 [Deltaproteobacteria bacterium]|nr:hypothetical protein [Deltaproteobacteria bacterium]